MGANYSNKVDSLKNVRKYVFLRKIFVYLEKIDFSQNSEMLPNLLLNVTKMVKFPKILFLTNIWSFRCEKKENFEN